MRRIGNRARILALSVSVVLSGTARFAAAQEPAPPGSEPAPPGGNEPSSPGNEPGPPGNEPAAPGSEPAAPGATGGGEAGKLGSISWQDIVTVPRRPILKY